MPARKVVGESQKILWPPRGAWGAWK